RSGRCGDLSRLAVRFVSRGFFDPLRSGAGTARVDRSFCDRRARNFNTSDAVSDRDAALARLLPDSGRAPLRAVARGLVRGGSRGGRRQRVLADRLVYLLVVAVAVS